MANYVLEGPKWGGSADGTPGGTVTWALDASVPVGFAPVLASAFADWSSHANIQFVQVASTASSRIDLSFGPIDGHDGILGEASYTYSGSSAASGTMASAAIEFDSGEGWHTSGSGVVSYDGANLFAVALHEIGHAIGMGHYDAAPAVMNATMDRFVTDLQSSDIAGIQAIYGASPSTGTGPHEVYRFFDTVTGDHFYTLDPNEKASIQANLPALRYEGTPWATPDRGADTVDVFRFYDTATGTHFLTSDAHERDTIMAQLPGFRYEGVAFEAYAAVQGAGEFALERFYNTITHLHTYAADAGEVAGIRSGQAGQGWVDEGASFVVHTPVSDLHA